MDETARFFTRSGVLTASRSEIGISLDFPAELETAALPPPGLIEALDLKPVCVGKNRFDYPIEVASDREVQDLAPDFSLLSRVPMRGVIVTSRSSVERYDFVSRFFAPAVGVNEDPVTGSAHCCLGPFWEKKLGRKELFARQISERGGDVRVTVGTNGRVTIGGKAVTVWNGQLTF